CLLTKDGSLKISDFGISKLRGISANVLPSEQFSERLSGVTDHEGIMGTPAYMAPEQFRSFADTDFRGDIYSFGVMLFQMITGRLPFEANDWHGLRRLHESSPAPSIGQYVSVPAVAEFDVV